jgi:hypothetical protein
MLNRLKNKLINDFILDILIFCHNFLILNYMFSCMFKSMQGLLRYLHWWTILNTLWIDYPSTCNHERLTSCFFFSFNLNQLTMGAKVEFVYNVLNFTCSCSSFFLIVSEVLMQRSYTLSQITQMAIYFNYMTWMPLDAKFKFWLDHQCHT